jgi:hypothetical protein
MSARTPDSIFYEDERYAILRVNPYDGLFDPKQFEITPEKLHTGAYRGFVCCYSIVNGTLLLSSLQIRAKGGLYPSINDAIPSFPSLEKVDPSELYLESDARDASGRMVWRCDDYAVYREIETPIAYTGTLRIGQDPDWKYRRSVIFGLQDWAYRKVVDLTFADGHLESVSDLSKEMGEIRKNEPTGEQYRPSNSKSGSR